MFLEKLEIQGFKSFANKNILLFPGMIAKDRRGLTAVVGPNGSGKSNIADAIRWVLGEQSMKTLRGKKSEDVIFSGSDKKGKLSMAEVSLHLNNEDKNIPLDLKLRDDQLADYSQIVITRRLYRDGDSEYLINNSRVRLTDVQLLLAKANFGQKTYSVIGQGMVEGFLNTSLSERKEFFDEATGVKQFQIKRDDSLNKLVNSYGNLNRANLLLAEIEPRLKSLTKQANKLKKRSQLEAELKELQLNYYSKIWQNINSKFGEFNQELLVKEKIKLDKDKKIALLNRELEQLDREEQDNDEYGRQQAELTALERDRDSVVRELARIDAAAELQFEAHGQYDLSWYKNKQTELKRESAAAAEEIKTLEKNIKQEQDSLEARQTEKNSLNQKINGLNHGLFVQTSPNGGRDNEQINQALNTLIEELNRLEAETDLNKIKAAIKKIQTEMKRLLKHIAPDQTRADMDKLRQELMELSQEKEDLLLKINESTFRINARSERVKLLKEQEEKIKQELANIASRLKNQGGENKAGNHQAKEQELKAKEAELEMKIKKIKETISGFAERTEAKKNSLFHLQKTSQALQHELNAIVSQLNDLKVNAARQETKLEDLETEIRNNLGGLKEVKEYQRSGDFELEPALEKINGLKRQLEQIGGIDPEVEKEFSQTKERYDYLANQINDLTQATGSLEKIIQELDAVIKQRFDKEFKVISLKFEEYFKILFNGGQAKIIKILADVETGAVSRESEAGEAAAFKPEPSAETESANEIKKIKFLQKYNATGLAGIEIQATPPGKKIKSVAMLSGGERALTAIALICAIIHSNPAPFVVLDEVDASLDEANSERLAKILDDLSHRTQFITITHNRASMRRASILYGITMGEDGVSKLLSIKLEELPATRNS